MLSRSVFRRSADVACSVALGLLVLAATRAAGDSPVGECNSPATPIHEIQGSGRSSPLLRATTVATDATEGVVVEAIVVGVFPGYPGGLGGFFLQEEDADADDDPRTSEGIFVFHDLAATTLEPGDRVRVRGHVREFFGLTELTRVGDIVVCPSGGRASPAMIRLPVLDEADWERWEGMLVRLEQPLVVSGHRTLDLFGELELAAGGRLEQPTQTSEPGAAALEAQARNARRRILLDDGSSRVRPDPVPYLDRRLDGTLDQTLDRNGGGTLRIGDRIDSLEGVLHFAFGRFRIQPTRRVWIEAAGSRPKHPPDVGGTLRVVGWNVENHMNGDGRGGGFPTRGPRDPDELERQRAKLVETLLQLDPDIATLVEIENDGTQPDSAIAQLVDALNARHPESPYEVVHPARPKLGRHPIAVGIVYRRDNVEPIGPAEILDRNVHAGFDDARHRPSLAQRFRARTTSELLTVVANHFKSKGSSCDAVGDPDRGDGQGDCNGTRAAAARALVDWLGEGAFADAPILLTGDLNAYPREDPIREFEREGFVDLVTHTIGPGAHTFVFNGQAGRLDYALAEEALLPFVSGAGIWHVNSDEPRVFGYDSHEPPGRYAPDPIRSSDHDPVLVGLFPDEDADGVTDIRDDCPGTVLSRTVVFGTCDTGVPNAFGANGCNLADDLLALRATAKRPGSWLRAIRNAVSLQIREGLLDPSHRGSMLACAGRLGV